MKLITSLFLAAATFTTSFSQKQDYNFNFKKIDTLKVFEPIGNISESNSHSIVPNSTLSFDFLEKFKGTFSEVAPFKVESVSNAALTEQENQKYFMKLMERVEKIDNESLSKIKIGEKLKDIISTESGRYFGFIFYSGLEVTKQENEMEVASNGNRQLYYPLATELPFIKNYIMIIDKQTDKVIYFHQNKLSSSPGKKENIEKQIGVLLGGI